jgi:hypothetical protein
LRMLRSQPELSCSLLPKGSRAAPRTEGLSHAAVSTHRWTRRYASRPNHGKSRMASPGPVRRPRCKAHSAFDIQRHDVQGPRNH